MARYHPTPLKGFCIVNLDTMAWALEPDQHLPPQQFDWFVPAYKQYLIDSCRKVSTYGGMFVSADISEVFPDGAVIFEIEIGNNLINLTVSGLSVRYESNLALQTYMRDEPIFFVANKPSLAIQQPVLDWMVGLQESTDVNDRALFAKIGPKMTFEHAIKHSERWHAGMAKKAEKRRKLGIVNDDPGCPVCLTLDGKFEGWTWRWLKSSAARDSEGDAMGHCVGRSNYDKLPPGEGIFSLRDPNNFPHVTMQLQGKTKKSTQAKGNSTPPAQYKPVIELAAETIGFRLMLTQDPATPIADGEHDDGGIKIWTKGEKLHREDGPAILGEWVEVETEVSICKDKNWFVPNEAVNLTRESGKGWKWENRKSKVKEIRAAEFWYRDGLLHREDGPAVYSLTRGFSIFYRSGIVVNADGSEIEKPKSKVWADPPAYWNGDNWQPGIAYAEGQVINNGTNPYVCVVAHTSSGDLRGDTQYWEAVPIAPRAAIRGAPQVVLLLPDREGNRAADAGNDRHILPVIALQNGANVGDWLTQVRAMVAGRLDRPEGVYQVANSNPLATPEQGFVGHAYTWSYNEATVRDARITRMTDAAEASRQAHRRANQPGTVFGRAATELRYDYRTNEAKLASIADELDRHGEHVYNLDIPVGTFWSAT